MLVEYIERDSLPEEQRRERLEAACLLASHLLYPTFVYDICLYWVDNYSNYTQVGREEDMFNEVVHQLLTQKPHLKQHVGEGIIHRSCNTYFYPCYIQLLGNGKLAWPAEYNEHRWHLSFVQTMHTLTQAHLKAFTQTTAVGLAGELALGGFVHDAVLEYFYEPALWIITAYMLHLEALVSVTGAREPVDWLPRHYYSLCALDEASLRDARCLSDTKRLQVLRGELRELHDVLNTPVLEKALHGVQALWHRKATSCWSQIFVRIAALLGAGPQQPGLMNK